MTAPATLQWEALRFQTCGIMTGCSSRHEWMLPWWFGNLRRHSQLPVMFIDMGMSRVAREWCLERGSILRMKTPVAHPYLCKPSGIIQSPYAQTLWTDLDCEILCPVDSIFSETTAEIGVVRDHPDAYDPIQGGVLVIRHGSATVLDWANLCLDWNKLDSSIYPMRRYDQSLLGYFWKIHPDAFTLLRTAWNHSRWQQLPGEINIVHWWGRDGKNEIRRRVLRHKVHDPVRALEPGMLLLITQKCSDIVHTMFLNICTILNRLARR